MFFFYLYKNQLYLSHIHRGFNKYCTGDRYWRFHDNFLESNRIRSRDLPTRIVLSSYIVWVQLTSLLVVSATFCLATVGLLMKANTLGDLAELLLPLFQLSNPESKQTQLSPSTRLLPERRPTKSNKIVRVGFTL